jgi:hypothetical protein
LFAAVDLQVSQGKISQVQKPTWLDLDLDRHWCSSNYPHGSNSTLIIKNSTLLLPFSLLLSFGAAKESKGHNASH